MKALISIYLYTLRGGSKTILVLTISAFAITTATILIVVAGALTFFRPLDPMDAAYQSMAIIALVLLIVPLISLGGTAARLSARRRDEKLSALRLLGASGGFVRSLTVLESTVLAAIGSVIGVILYAALTPLVGLLHFRGNALGASALLLAPSTVLAVLAVITVLAALSSLVGLRRVVISPLGVRTEALSQRPKAARLAIGAAAILIASAISVWSKATFDPRGGLTVIIILVTGFALALAVVNVIGPWVLSVIARVSAKRANDATKLLAARAVMSNPKAAWQQVSAAASTSFVAVFAGVALSFASANANSADSPGFDTTKLLTADITTGVILTIAISFIMVACSAGISQASEVLDRKNMLVAMDCVGVPRSTFTKARSRALMLPLISAMLGSALIAFALVSPLAAASLLFSPLTLLTILVALVAGVALVWVAIQVTRPVTQAVLLTRARVAD